MFTHFLTGRGEQPLDTTAAVDLNLQLAGLFAEAVLDDPALLEHVPAGATLVLVPDDEPDLRLHNLNLAMEAFAIGRNVYLVHVRLGETDVRPRTERAAG